MYIRKKKNVKKKVRKMSEKRPKKNPTDYILIIFRKYKTKLNYN